MLKTKYKKNWAVVANRESAQIFEVDRGDPPHLVRHLENPRGRLMNREINADRPGRTKDRVGNGRHAMMRSRSPKEQNLIDFAKEIGGVIEKARSQKRFQKVFLIAPSKLLGELKSSLTASTQKVVGGSYVKNFSENERDKKLMALLFKRT